MAAAANDDIDLTRLVSEGGSRTHARARTGGEAVKELIIGGRLVALHSGLLLRLPCLTIQVETGVGATTQKKLLFVAST